MGDPINPVDRHPQEHGLFRVGIDRFVEDARQPGPVEVGVAPKDASG